MSRAEVEPGRPAGRGHHPVKRTTPGRLLPPRCPFRAGSVANFRVRPVAVAVFEVDAEVTTVATLYALYQKGLLPAQTVEAAIQKLGIDPEKSFPFFL